MMRKNKTTHFMTIILTLMFIVFFLIITGRFLYIQATGEVNNVSLVEWAEEKRSSSYTLQAERGKIYDSNGTTLAYDRPTYKIYAIIDENISKSSSDVKHVENIEETAEQLAPLLGVKKSFVVEQIENGIKNEKFQVEFGNAGKELTQQKRDEIKDLQLPGINFDTESIRYYPNGMFAAHVLGFARKEMVDHDEGENDDDSSIEEVTGVTGIEKQMNEDLKGEDGYISFQRDKYNRKLLDPDEVVKAPSNGNSIYLTIEQKVQTLLDDVMSEVVEEYDPERITATVMNAKTGEIIAMGNRPSYNPNEPADVQNWYNDVISSPFEPGSTVKMFTWAAAIDAGVYVGDELYKSGRYRANERLDAIEDHNNGDGWGLITFDEGFKRSSNVAASILAWEKIGTEKYYDYLTAFDFDKKTNIDLPSEVPGQILFNWPLEKITTSFGQGSTVTPIQQMKAATAIANEGKMLEPYVIKKIVDTDTEETIKENSPKVVGEPISKETAEQVLDLLESVVDSDEGTGKVYKLDDYSLAGKTGTAEIPNPNGTGYLPGRENNIFSFLGMAPKDDPELIMYVSVNQPKLENNELGSTPVSFIFKNVMENSLHYLNIDPDKDENDTTEMVVPVNKIIGQKTETVKEELIEKGIEVITIGSGKKIVDSTVKEGDALFKGERILLVTDKPTMPDIVGWSHRKVLQLADLLQLKVETIGNGYVTTQNIKKGTPLKKNAYLGVELELPKHEQLEELIKNSEEE